MSSKIGLILSLGFIALFFLFGIDIITLQFAYSELDSRSTTIGYQISKNARIDNDFITLLENKYKVSLFVDQNQSCQYGDIISYQLATNFNPLVISSDTMTIKIERTTAIGFYG